MMMIIGEMMEVGFVIVGGWLSYRGYIRRMRFGVILLRGIIEEKIGYRGYLGCVVKGSRTIESFHSATIFEKQCINIYWECAK